MTDADAAVMLDRLEWRGRLPDVWPCKPPTAVKRALLARGLGWEGQPALPHRHTDPDHEGGWGSGRGYGNGRGNGFGLAYGSGVGDGNDHDGRGNCRGGGDVFGDGFGDGFASMPGDGRGEAVP